MVLSGNKAEEYVLCMTLAVLMVLMRHRQGSQQRGSKTNREKRAGSGEEEPESRRLPELGSGA